MVVQVQEGLEKGTNVDGWLAFLGCELLKRDEQVSTERDVEELECCNGVGNELTQEGECFGPFNGDHWPRRDAACKFALDFESERVRRDRATYTRGGFDSVEESDALIVK
jgi:hypothetical protein